ncbi:tyrosine-type recombinase/integrase [Rhodobacter sp. CZR27]|uniref:tyrosine-type recombinase/integrase n=1 Tax=Rhodobacter sp. CZR27 TaxID=2033869 RepID=UPI000BBEF55A|nr:tyrosine-type recombinase/integrase [Rhodobacter sp. CZR27]
MGLSLTLKHLKQLGPGRYAYRRRVPESAKTAMGKGEFKRVFTANGAAAVAKEHARITAEFDRAVMQAAKVGMGGAKDPTPREAAEVNALRASDLLRGVHGVSDEDEARELLADLLGEEKADPALYRAVKFPAKAPPAHTLEDARKLYLKEKLAGGEGDENRHAAERLARVFARVGEALGDRARTCALSDLVREDARKVRDHMLACPKKGGGTLSPASVRREMNTLSAVVNFGLTEFDLRGKVANPFEGLTITGASSGKAITEADKRDPLPVEVITAMGQRLTGKLVLLWRLLAGTGCRLAEVAGLRVQDVVLTGPVPHIRVAWHEDRRLKTAASIRSVPLVGDALGAAKEAVKAADGAAVLFPRYARPRGSDAASAILMKHLRKETTNPRHTVHSLRHNMKDSLRLAGVEKTVQDLVLGHASPSIGEIYGGEAARLEVAHRALLKVAQSVEPTSS